MSEPKISIPRAIAGFAAGAAFVLAVYSWLLWPAWDAVLLVGGGLGAAFIAILGLPVFFFLRKKGMLSVYAAAILGSIFCMGVPLYIAVANMLEGMSMPSLSATELIFWLQYFLLPGLAGGIIGWLVAAGFRIRAS